MPCPDRHALLARLHEKVRRGEPIVGGGAGIGLSARCEEAGGIDLIVLYNSGRYRMAGRGSLAGLLAYGNANEIVLQMAREVLPVVTHTPVLAGVNGTDPFLLTEHFLTGLKAMGIAGIQNFPTVGLIDGVFRQNLEETGMSYALEVEMMRTARRLDMLTTPYVFSRGECAGDGRGGRRYHHRAYGADERGRRRRRHRIVACRMRAADRSLCKGRAGSAARTCWCSATAARSRHPTTCASCSMPALDAMGSTAHPAWSACRSRRRSPNARGSSSRCAGRPRRREESAA